MNYKFSKSWDNYYPIIEYVVLNGYDSLVLVDINVLT